MNHKLMRPKTEVLLGLLSPGLLIYCFIVVLPLFVSFRYSLFDWSGGINMEFVGLGNYIDLVQDGDFWFSFKNNVMIIMLSILGQVGIAFVVSALLMSKLLKWREFHRVVIFLPVVLSAVVIGFLWTIIYSKDMGLLNWLLKALHLESFIIPWLDDPRYVIYTVTIPLIWQYIGFYLIIFMAAMQSIPKDIFEVADIDGATGIKKAVYITLPLLYDTLKVAIMLCIAGNMKVFDHIYVMTGGGPGKSSTVMAQYAYDNSFVMFKLGYGSAISIGILVLSLALILLSRKLMGGNKNEA